MKHEFINVISKQNDNQCIGRPQHFTNDHKRSNKQIQIKGYAYRFLRLKENNNLWMSVSRSNSKSKILYDIYYMMYIKNIILFWLSLEIQRKRKNVKIPDCGKTMYGKLYIKTYH